VSRAEEYALGSARNAFQGNIKVGFDAAGKLLAADVYVVQDSGAHISFWDYRNFADGLALVYQPKAMRFRGVPVFTNALTRTAQRGPGQNQLACIMEPLVDRAARELNVDRVEIRKKNDPVNGSLSGGDEGKRTPASSAYVREALDKGRAKFNWDERRKRSGQKNGPRVTGIGVGQAVHPAGFTGFDGLLCLKPDGKLHVHTGVGNLGTFSHSGTSRIAAEVLKRGLPRGTFHSVNLPAAAIKGIKIVPHSLKAGTNAYDRRETPRHELYFWNLWTEPVDPGSATDVGAITDGYVAVTPLRIDANDDVARKAIEAWSLR